MRPSAENKFSRAEMIVREKVVCQGKSGEGVVTFVLEIWRFLDILWGIFTIGKGMGN